MIELLAKLSIGAGITGMVFILIALYIQFTAQRRFDRERTRNDSRVSDRNIYGLPIRFSGRRVAHKQ